LCDVGGNGTVSLQLGARLFCDLGEIPKTRPGASAGFKKSQLQKGLEKPQCFYHIIALL
jgi:hypothetical protein